jgi:hypothetical protein
MRGLMFNYLLKYIESYYSYALVDTILETSTIETENAFADGGMYEDGDFIKLIETASKTLQVPMPQLLLSYGRYIFPPLYEKFLTIYGKNTGKYSSINTAFDFIDILKEIHYKEVVKLYPDSIFPHFEVLKHDNTMMEINYHSERNLPFLAKGLLEGCIEYFDETLTIEMKDDSKEGSTHFIIRKEQT